MSLNQMDDFTFKHSGQLDAIYTQYTAQQVKALFDSRGDELRIALNLLITTLKSTEGASDIGTSTIQNVDGVNIQAMLQSIRDKLKATADGTSGADFVNATAISGLTGNTVQTLLEGLKTYADSLTASDIEATPIANGSGSTVQAQLAWLLNQIVVAATGSIVDGSIGEVKLSPALLNKINLALSNEGLLSLLLSIDKSSLVNAINEVIINLVTHEADNVYQVAGGTATAITLTGVVLEDGHPKTFIASANNSGATTTINTKPLYKPGTTTAPNLIAGKAYTVWYNVTGVCFFIKASATGTASVGDVLANVPFSNENDTDLIGTLALTGSAGDSNVLNSLTYYNTDAKTKRTGTMTNKVGSATIITPGVSDQAIPQGYYGGVIGDGKVIGDANHVAPNIKLNVVDFGVTGTFNDIVSYAAGNNIISSNVTSSSGSIGTTYTLARDTQLLRGGTVRVTFDLRWSGSGGTAYGQIYKNGVAYGTERTTTSSTFVQFTEDLTFSANDHIQLYLKGSTSNTYPMSALFQISAGQVLVPTIVT